MADLFPVLGFDIGGTKIAVSLLLSDGSLIASSRVSNHNRAPEDVLPEIVAAAKKLLADTGYSQDSLKAVGICAPSPFDFEKGVILNPVNMPEWRNVPIREYLADALHTRAFFDNDANASVLAEWLFGAGVGAKNMLYIALSTGIGSGIIANEHLVRGETCDAGEVGHMILEPDGPLCQCGLRGCWESLCGGRAIARRLQKELAEYPDCRIMQLAGTPDKIDMKILAAAVREDDPMACAVWDEMMERDARAIGMLINIFNPQIIALGTIAIECESIFMPLLHERIRKYAWKKTASVCTVTPGKLGHKLGEISGAAIALYGLYENGEWELPR